jgi:GT2 family glycosyltransferase
MQLIQTHPAVSGLPSGAGRHVGVLVINYNTSAQTLRCLASLGHCEAPPAWIEVLDNASASDDSGHLQTHLPHLPYTQIRLLRSDTNLGFAAGSNRLADHLLAQPECHYMGLLNSDAVAQPAWLGALVAALQTDLPNTGMAGGRMHKLGAPDQVDTLGICMYASLMPADRHDIRDPYLGPTGGCCLMTRDFVKDVIETTGYLFDERYFCYCEDTDLVLRARLLGYSPAYTDQLVALHEGQASSGSGYNTFIAYHGLRNTLWMHAKLFSTGVLWRHLHWLLLAHLMSIARHTFSGHPGLIWRVYRDALAQWESFRHERTQMLNRTRITPDQLRSLFSRQFYRAGYTKLVLRQITQRLFKPTVKSTRSQ